MSNPLFREDEGDSGDDVKFATNEVFAKVFNEYRKNEFLKKCEQAISIEAHLTSLNLFQFNHNIFPLAFQ